METKQREFLAVPGILPGRLLTVKPTGQYSWDRQEFALLRFHGFPLVSGIVRQNRAAELHNAWVKNLKRTGKASPGELVNGYEVLDERPSEEQMKKHLSLFIQS